MEVQLVIALAELGARLATRAIEARAQRKMEAMTPAEVLAAAQALVIQDVDALLRQGQEDDGA